MPGFSLTLLLLPRTGAHSTSAEDILRLLDAPVSAPGWKWHATADPQVIIDVAAGKEPESLVTNDLPPLVRQCNFILRLTSLDY